MNSNTKHNGTPAAFTPGPDRSEYKCETGCVSWWSKDGAWHIAIAEEGRKGFYWTAEQFQTREQAITALAKAQGVQS